MSVIDSVLRRSNRSNGVESINGKAQRVISINAAKKKSPISPGGSRLYQWSFTIHKWAGLIGAAWLALLGFTGFLLNHEDWRWEQQGKAPAFLTPLDLQEFAARNVTRYLQIDPADDNHRITGGPRGLWFTTDAGTNWTPTKFEDGDHPQINVILPQGEGAWDRLWFGTDNGAYFSTDGGKTTRPAGLQGKHVTALAQGASSAELFVVVDRTYLYRYRSSDFSLIDEVKLAPLDRQTRPPEVEMLRFVHDLHLGKSFFGPSISLTMNDIGGLGMFILSLTGLLYWGMPKFWKYKASKAKGTNPTYS